MAAGDVIVNGINLNTLAYQVDVITGRRTVPIRADLGAVLPGVHGQTSGVGTFGVQPIGLSIWVDATDPTTGEQAGRLQKNLEAVGSAFLRPTGMVQLTVGDDDGLLKTATGKLLVYTVDEAPTYSRVNVALQLHSVFWRGTTARTFTSSTFGTAQVHTGLQADQSTAPISDAVYTVYGPITNPTITDAVNNRAVNLLSQTLTSNEAWELDCKARTSSKVLVSTGAKTPVMDKTRWVAAASGAPLLELWPANYDLTSPYQYRLNVSGTGTTGASYWKAVATAAYY